MKKKYELAIIAAIITITISILLLTGGEGAGQEVAIGNYGEAGSSSTINPFLSMNYGDDINGNSAETPVPTLEGTVEAAEGDEDVLFDQAVAGIFQSASEEFTGAGTEAGAYHIITYDLITDSDLADPAYMGHPKGFKVTLILNTTPSGLKNTLWGYEVDATRIADAFYGEVLNDKTGFVAVYYVTGNSQEPFMYMVLTADDAGSFSGVWDGTGYISKNDWTRIEYPESGFCMYEEAGKALIPGDQSPGGISETGIIAYPIPKGEIRNTLFITTVRLNEIVNKIGRSSEQADFSEMAFLSEELIGESYLSEEHISAMVFPEELSSAKEEYLTALDEYRKAGSSFWQGASFTNNDQISEGNIHLMEAINHTNTALGLLDLSPIEQSVMAVPADELYPDASYLAEHYTYQDASGANDASVRPAYLTYSQFYVLESDGVTQHIRAGYGKKFLFILIEEAHRGYRGGGSELVLTPSPGDFTLLYEGEEIAQQTPAVYIDPVGHPLKQQYLQRKETNEGFIAFEVPENFNTKNAYLLLDLGQTIPVAWHLTKRTAVSL